MIVETIAVGTELLLGQIVNTNASTIGAKLADAGFDHFHQTVVGDNLPRMIDAFDRAVERADAVIITGGIGPTQDDVTRQAIAAVAGAEMAFSQDYADELRRRWEAQGRTMPESNLRQAEYPEGADMIPNPKGSAPGIRMRIRDAWVFAVPGVPAEMELMLRTQVLPFLFETSGEAQSVVVSRVIRSWGLSESQVGEILGDVFEESANPTIAFLASSGEIKVRATAKAVDVETANQLIDPVEAEVRRRLGSTVFGIDDQTIERVLLDALAERSWTLATAESATGGLVAGRITAVPGASKVFKGSVVSYATAVKETVLGVDADLIADAGVVSEEVAASMAEGAARALDADVVISVTGSAGPEAQGRPVGTMVVGVRTPEDVRTRTIRLPGDRERVRAYTATAALHLARLGVTGVWWGSDRDSMWGVRSGSSR